ncbi:hypothetical protein LKL81_24225 [Bacillus paranthracis]|uniref:hypothetical protein n=1 Tax=Bacillus TaxID=1386 RepID=UPI000279E8D4|nr:MULTISPECIES: hypothetical protein [Bacillus]EJR17900.1 hypothetical protein II9_02102 [Bacillus cereus MSX-D12]KMP40154.1 hypothetical protein TU55_24215 [Bacillus cereus]KMP67181.1 hypothetical protein TU61_12995 [Bacillus cereus]MCC2374084.1 hypothetical protein [Bacillus paranthracis]MCC2430326.1 hypothetical protein [Bacillus paranthracis]
MLMNFGEQHVNFDIESVEALTIKMERISQNHKKTFEEKLKWSRDIHDLAMNNLNMYSELLKKEFGSVFRYKIRETIDEKDEKKRILLDCEKFIDNRIQVYFPDEVFPILLNNGYRVLTVNNAFPTTVTISKETKTAKKPCELYSLPNLQYFTWIYWDKDLERIKEVIIVKQPFRIFERIKFNPEFEFQERETEKGYFVSIPVEQELFKELIVLHLKPEDYTH